MRRVCLSLVFLMAVAASARAQLVIPSPQSINVQDSGTACSNTGTCAAWPNISNTISLTFQLTGTCGTCTVTFEGTSDNSTWFALSATNLNTTTAATTTTSTGQYTVTNVGLTGVRARLTARSSGGFNVSLTRGLASSRGGAGGGGVTSITGTANEVIASAATGAVTLSTPQDIGTASTPRFASMGLGGVAGTAGQLLFYGTGSGTVTVQPAAAAGTWTMTLPTSNGGTAHFVLETDGAGVTSWIGGQSISGLTTASQPQFGGLKLGSGRLLTSSTAPTISSGFGSSPSISASNGPSSFIVNVGTGASASSGVIGLPTASTGWSCFVNDLTAAAAHLGYNTRQTADSTTSATFENQTTSTGAAVAWGSADLLRICCFAY